MSDLYKAIIFTALQKKLKYILKYAVLLFSILSSLPILSQKPTKGTIPDWVEKSTYSTQIDQEEEAGYYYLLSDKQLNTIEHEFYARTVVQVINTEGISQLSDITFEFDPEYEKLIFHNIEVLRDGQRINKLELNRIQTIQRESNLERNLYDGRLTSIVNLQDIREGDILDYSYSINGSNPVYEGDYGNELNLQYALAIGELKYRLIASKSNLPQLDFRNNASKPEITDIGNKKVYQWSEKNVPAKYADNNTPLWYDDYPKVYTSTHGTWEDIVNQYSQLYELSSTDKNKLKRLIGQSILIDKEIKLSKDKQITELINFVQDDIRYFGFENGLNSHTPESPIKVLNQRYGDCKGKSLLLVELLNNIGVEAYPMLVNSSKGEALSDRLPSPNLFDHCVVNYSYEGQEFYIDPTISNQGGGVHQRTFPNYKKGLVLKPGVKELVDIPNYKEYGIEIQEIYDIDKINGAGVLTVMTTYKGSNADYTRADFAQRSNSVIQKEYLQFYSILFPSIAVDGKITVEDSRGAKNTFTVRESYKIDSIWQKSPENEKLLYFEIYPLSLENYISTAKSPARTSPYYLSYPAAISYDISVNLPEEWPIDPINTKMESDYFKYTHEVDSYLNKILVTHNYERKKDFIPANDVAKYIAQHEKIQNDLSYYVTYDQGLADGSGGSGLSWVAMFLTIVALVLSCYGAYILYFDYDVIPEMTNVRAKPIGGWLILIAIGLILTPILILIDLVGENGFYDAYTWSVLWNTEGMQGKPNVILIAIELMINLARIIFAIILIILFFERRSTVPRLMVILFASTAVFIILDAIAAYAINGDVFSTEEDQATTKEIVQSIIRAAIWIPYFLISKRVKETFVNRSKNSKNKLLESAHSESDTARASFISR